MSGRNEKTQILMKKSVYLGYLKNNDDEYKKSK